MAAVTPPHIDSQIATLIRLAVREDLGHAADGGGQGDKTVELCIPPESQGVGKIVARKAGVVSGTFLLQAILDDFQAGVECEILTGDGVHVGADQVIAEIKGPARTILSAERVLLNFLGHLSGIATMTRRFVDAVAKVPHPPAICDTRKTTPGFRRLDKYAVTCGGGVNHRMGLYDGVMVKDNHLAALRERLGQGLALAALMAHIRQELPAQIPLWLEVDTMEQLKEALAGDSKSGKGADIILLDNFTSAQMKVAVQLRNAAPSKSKILLEASGGITLENVAEVAATGVERISIGALTHSAPALDVSLELS